MAKREFDEDVDKGESTVENSVIDAINEYRLEAEEARYDRLRRNRTNRDVYLGRQDWSHKEMGQSTEFLPKVPVAVEQMSSFVKRGLVQFGDWFQVELDRQLNGVIDGDQVRTIIMAFFDNIWAGNDRITNLSTILSDGTKVGLLESLMIFKVHGGIATKRRFDVEPGDVELTESGAVIRGVPKLKTDEIEEWRLRVDLIRPEDYYPDPTGNNLYEIHRCERDLHEVLAMVDEGVYDEAAVEELIDTDFERPDDEKRKPEAMDQGETVKPKSRKRVMLDEFWGTILKADGTIAHRNVVATVANGKYLIRPPEPNPFWHQESPFVVAPIVRVPFSVWHKALYDHASELNLAINEMFNLMLDGGMAQVWGVRQIRLEDLEDPSQVDGGVPQGITLAVKNTLPHGQKVMDQVTEGDIPSDAMAIFEFLNRSFTEAALINELKLGSLPPKQVRATEVIEAAQSQAVTLDGIIADLESGPMKDICRKSWLTILQNADDLPKGTLQSLIDKQTAQIIMNASPAERFALFADRTSFKVNGLSATMSRMRDFQKVMALMQAVMTNPMLFQAFMVRFSADKTLRHLMRTLNLNPDSIQKDAEELAKLPEEIKRTLVAGTLLGSGGGRGGGFGGENAGEPGLTSEVNQQQFPATGMAPNA